MQVERRNQSVDALLESRSNKLQKCGVSQMTPVRLTLSNNHREFLRQLISYFMDSFIILLCENTVTSTSNTQLGAMYIYHQKYKAHFEKIKKYAKSIMKYI